jgi:cellobiose phosphorylase
MGTEIPELTVTRTCRGASYRVRIRNVRGNGDVKLTVDGLPLSGHLVPYAPAGTTVAIDCEA